jgi:hypothetical protein
MWNVIYDENVNASCYNEAVRANLTIRVYELSEDATSELYMRATLNVSKNPTSINSTLINLDALGFRIHDEKDTKAKVSVGTDSFRGQNVKLGEVGVAGTGWLDEEVSIRVPVQGEANGKPTNASFASALTWTLYDYSEKTPHSLNVTGEVYYSEPGWIIPKVWLISTSVELKMNLGDHILTYSFDNGIGGWKAWDNNSENGNDTWDATSYRLAAGTYSVWCAQSGTHPSEHYDDNMDSYMETEFPDLSNYSKAYVHFLAWIDTEENHDYFYVQYYDSASSQWNTALTYSGPISKAQNGTGTLAGWMGLRVELPNSATKFRFRFYSDNATNYEGVYIDEVVLFAMP